MSSQTRRLKFIMKVREHPCLWNTDSESYHVLTIKDAEWQQIVDDLNCKEVPDIKTARREWKKLRDNHRDALKRNKSNANLKWRYTDSMEFLVPFMKTRHRKRVLITPEKSPTPKITMSPRSYFDNSDGEAESTSANNEFQSRNIKCEQLDIEEESNNHIDFNVEDDMKEVCKCCCHFQAEQGKHPIDSFYQYLSNATKQLPSNLQNSVKKKMFAVLTEAEDSIINESLTPSF